METSTSSHQRRVKLDLYQTGEAQDGVLMVLSHCMIVLMFL